MRVLDIFRPPLVALDLGTTTMRVSFGGTGVMELPSVIREDLDGKMVERSTMRAGVVSDIAGAASVIGNLLTHRGVFRRRPGAIVCAPSDVTPGERDALIEAVVEGGASVAAVVPEPLAAAIGAHVDVASEYATALVDIGDGVTDFAVFRSGAMVRSHAMRIGCGNLRTAVEDWIEFQFGEVPPLHADAVEAIVRAYCRGDAVREVPGLRRDDIEMLLEPALDEIASFVSTTFRNLPDAMAAEIIESGIHVTGGGARLGRLIARIEQKVGIPLSLADEPLQAVVRGAGEMLRNRQLLATAS